MNETCGCCGGLVSVRWHPCVGGWRCDNCHPDAINYESPPKALSTQVGGEHYKKYKIQPVTYCQLNKLGYCESNIVKYISRWKDKGGIKDLKKVKHYVDLLIEIEGLEE